MNSLYIALAGTFINGFKAFAFNDVESMGIFTRKEESRGRMASSVRLLKPENEAQPGYAPDGKFLVALGCIASGISVYGPFATEEDADTFGEDGDGLDDNTYAVLTLEGV